MYYDFSPRCLPRLPSASLGRSQKPQGPASHLRSDGQKGFDLRTDLRGRRLKMGEVLRSSRPNIED